MLKRGKISAEYLRNLMMGFIIIFCSTYVVVTRILYFNNSTDFYQHGIWAQELHLSDFLKFLKNVNAYPIWHIVVKAFSSRMQIEIDKSIALATALFNAFAFLAMAFLYNCILGREETNFPKEKQVFWITCLMFAGPLYAPWFNKNYYLGQGIANTWHNPTLIAVKGIAVLSFTLILHLISDKEHIEKKSRYFAVITVILLISVFAKPSFLQGFIPGLGLFILLRLVLERKNFDWKFYSLLVISFVPAVLMMLFQVFAAFYYENSIGTGSGLGIEFGRVLGNWTNNLFLSFLLLFAFPLFVLITSWKEVIKKKPVQLAICYETATWLEAAFLYEKGRREHHGNFLWANETAILIVWLVLTFYFLNNFYALNEQSSRKQKVFVIIGTILFTTHLLFGIFYWYNICNGGSVW